MNTRHAILAALSATALALPGAAHAVAPAGFGTVDEDADHPVFTTTERMVPADRDNQVDIYERSGGVTRLVSVGPAGGNGPFDPTVGGISDNGKRIVFTTDERLTADDTDSVRDVYIREDGATERASTGGAQFPGNSELQATLKNVAPNGTFVYETREKLAANDLDTQDTDLYYFDQSGGLASRPTTQDGINGDESFEANYAGTGSSGAVVFFHTQEKLSTADGDSAQDVYSFGVNTDEELVSDSPGDEGAAATFRGVGKGGGLAVYTTNEQVSAADSDDDVDAYSYQLSTNTRSFESADFDAEPIVVKGVASVEDDIYIETAEAPPASGDLDAATDVYRLENGNSELVSRSPVVSQLPATFLGADSEGHHVAFSTAQQLAGGADTDNASDIYEEEGPVIRLVSRTQGSGGAPIAPTFHGYYDNKVEFKMGVLYSTTERQLPGDTDCALDVYARADETSTQKLSPGNGTGNAAFFGGASDDGKTIVFSSSERLAPQDGEGFPDIYRARPGSTDLVSFEQIAPDTAITAGPGPFSNDPTPAFSYRASEADVTFACRFDGGPFGPCGPRPALADGSHTHQVRATDRAGNVDATPATRQFAIDTQGPRVGIATAARRASRKGTFKVRLSCPASEIGACTGMLTLKSAKRLRLRGGKRRTVTFATARFTIAKGTSKAVSIKLSRTNRARLKKLGKVRLAAQAAARDSLGNTGLSSARIKLKAPTRRR